MGPRSRALGLLAGARPRTTLVVARRRAAAVYPSREPRHDASIDTCSVAARVSGVLRGRAARAGGLDPPQRPGAGIQRTGAARQRRPAEIRAGGCDPRRPDRLRRNERGGAEVRRTGDERDRPPRADGHARDRRRALPRHAVHRLRPGLRGRDDPAGPREAAGLPRSARPGRAQGQQRPALRAQFLRRGALAARDAADARGPRPARHDPPGPGAQCRWPQVLAEQPRDREPRHRRAHARPARRPDRPRRAGPAERLLRRHGRWSRAVARSRRCRRRRRSSSCGSRTPTPTAWESRPCSFPARSRTGCRAGRRCSRKAGSRCAPTSRSVRGFRARHAGARRACEAHRRARRRTAATPGA